MDFLQKARIHDVSRAVDRDERVRKGVRGRVERDHCPECHFPLPTVNSAACERCGWKAEVDEVWCGYCQTTHAKSARCRSIAERSSVRSVAVVPSGWLAGKRILGHRRPATR